MIPFNKRATSRVRVSPTKARFAAILRLIRGTFYPYDVDDAAHHADGFLFGTDGRPPRWTHLSSEDPESPVQIKIRLGRTQPLTGRDYEALMSAQRDLAYGRVDYDPEKRIAQGAIFTQSSQCHLADLSCDGRRHLFDLRVRAWTNGSALPFLYEQLLCNHRQVNHTRAITHVNEKLVEVASEFSCRVHGTTESAGQAERTAHSPPRDGKQDTRELEPDSDTQNGFEQDCINCGTRGRDEL